MNLNLVGVATKPQALKGQFRIKPEILNLKEFKRFNSLTIDNKEYDIEAVTLRDTFVIVKLKGIDTCEQAESFRNKKVFAEMEVVVEDNFDIINFAVELDGEAIGKVTEINNYGSKDICTISTNNGDILLPLIDNLIVSIDEEKLVVIMDKNIFAEVAVYEN
jgi:16S rRNA processing protein RimM